MTIINMKGL